MIDIDNKCKVEPVTLKAKRVQELYPAIADQLWYCWDKVGGRTSPIGKKAILGWDILPDTKSCFVCSQFMIDESMGDVKIAEVLSYLNSRPRGSDKTYLDLLDTDWIAPDNQHFFFNTVYERQTYHTDAKVKLVPLEKLVVAPAQQPAHTGVQLARDFVLEAVLCFSHDSYLFL